MPDKLLIVDDEIYNLEIIREFLGEEYYELEYASDGESALEVLDKSHEQFSAILLDRVMPGMDGMDVLRKISVTYRDIPVILQTSLDKPEDVTEGIHSGAWYYLTKPLDDSALRQVVAAAIQDYHQRKEFINSSSEFDDSLNLGVEGTFHFRTMAEVTQISNLLARMCSDHVGVGMGLMELMRNAVEHGNLGITYDDKTTLLKQDRLFLEIDSRLANNKYAGRKAIVTFSRDNNKIKFTITDEGDGFNWRDYLDIDPRRVFDVHGRGIAMARKMAFSSMKYNEKGNSVTVTADA